LDEILFRLITTFDEVPPNFRVRLPAPAILHRRGVCRIAKFMVLT
jgi:hypothetical protein